MIKIFRVGGGGGGGVGRWRKGCVVFIILCEQLLQTAQCFKFQIILTSHSTNLLVHVHVHIFRTVLKSTLTVE